jgi:hypothetical protein
VKTCCSQSDRRIDVVIIEPGTVNTTMYDKGEKEGLSEFKADRVLGVGAELSEVDRRRSTNPRLGPWSGRSRPRSEASARVSASRFDAIISFVIKQSCANKMPYLLLLAVEGQ